MANCMPFNSMIVDGEYDRVFKAEDWAWYFATFLANGIFPKPSDGLQVVAYNKMEVRVNIGYAFINGYAFRNPSTKSLTLSMAEGALNRIDRIVIRWDLPKRDIYITVLKGSPSVNPKAASLTRNTEIWELAIADVYVSKGVTKIQTKDIKDQRFNSSLCGIVVGTIEEIDASVLTKQFNDFFETYSENVVVEFDLYKQNMNTYFTQLVDIYNDYVCQIQDIFNQYESNANEKYIAFEDELNRKKDQLLIIYTEYVNRISSFEAEAEEKFNAWFENIKDKLSEDAAGNLQLEIEELQNVFNPDLVSIAFKSTFSYLGDIEDVPYIDPGAMTEEDILNSINNVWDGEASLDKTALSPADIKKVTKI